MVWYAAASERNSICTPTGSLGRACSTKAWPRAARGCTTASRPSSPSSSARAAPRREVSARRGFPA
ncbi:hypothetical protein MGG_13180 [Pyricularia oryzae 70-15]|uniref:Uncharacterized protein n=1 Tax=Pyricularia oryzae (strain 70-15 / ATCC MYA-4617 / FGSC 8958) TaxID=242507 RepID=G4N0G4_PYRO7|nr:uncharacterized protein MGG_13180 [Pyricularia oryzae 70-15]EHA52298.1 hypothetical protein MGG_13180 [Pyricularia oryzae 70-15]